jgi:Phytanoyl-CoA dioxygenase (PhyH)
VLSPVQQAEFDRRGLLRLPGALTGTDVGEMRDRVWSHLWQTYGARPERSETWPATTPAHFQTLIGTGAFDPMATPAIRAAVDTLLGPPGWREPNHWGRPLVTFPQRGTPWRLPATGWHMDSAGRPGDPLLVLFACLAAVRSRGGGTLVVTGSHRLTAPGRRYAGLRSADVRARLAGDHPWFRDLLTRGDEPARTERLLSSGSRIDGADLRIDELAGDAGDVFVMHPRLLHAVAPNALDVPRLMLLQFIEGSP